jgi:hypothetical protein
MYVVGGPKDPTMRQLEQLRTVEVMLEWAVDRAASNKTPIEVLRARLTGMRAELAYLEKK